MSRLVVAIGHVEFTIAAQTLYVVKVQQDADEWEVKRTYSDFRKLRDDVARVIKHDPRAADESSRAFAGAAHELPFPAKRLFGSRSNRVVRERAVELHQFLIRLLLLTHTFRKAQKQQLGDDGDTQASASVFFLLRDFLKPESPFGSGSGGGGGSGGAGTGGAANGAGGAGPDDDVATRRMIRESKMLSMRSSAAAPLPPQQQPKTKSAPNVLAYSDESDDAAAATHASKFAAQLLRQQSSIPILEEVPAAHASSKTVSIAALRSRSQRTDSNSSKAAERPRNVSTASSTTERQRNASNASNASSTTSSTYYSNSRRKHSTAVEAEAARQHFLQQQQQQQREHRHHNNQPPPSVLASVQQGGRVGSSSSMSAASSSSTPSAPIAIQLSPPPSSATSSSSSMYIHGSAPSSTSAAAASRAYPSSSTTTSSDRERHEGQRKSPSSGGTSAERRAKHTSQKKSPARSKQRSASAREARDTERKSKLSPQLTAQAVTINAQKELEQFVSEYSAIMILRYVDRFVSKAATKAPGCYTVSADDRLVIDSERFLEELDETFKDLPSDFADNFKNPLTGGEWYFPSALDAYVQMKWKSFRGHAGASAKSAYLKSRTLSRRRDSDSSDSDDSEYEYEETIISGFMKPKRDFTDEEADVLDKMIADGTAGRDQMLRLRRQKNEGGWNRRANPGDERTSFVSKKAKAGKMEYWTDTEDDEHRQTGSSGGEEQAPTSADHYQRKYNTLRKERRSRREGGLV